MSKKITKEEFIEKAINVHGYSYDYSKVDYKSTDVKVEIICKLHGSFFQKPNNHISGKSGCPKCFLERRKNKRNRFKNTEDFIKKCNEVHNNKYNYEKTIFENTTKDIIIKCPIHGEFKQRASNHLQGNGCKKCSDEESKQKKTTPFSVFLKKANQKHNNYFFYYEETYVNLKEKITIECPIHGKFEQSCYRHLRSSFQKCPKCSGKNQNTQSFIEKAINIHGNDYDYSLSFYNCSNEKLKIKCNKHNIIFEMTPHNHVGTHKQGCPICRYEKIANKRRLSKKDFIEKSNEVHGNIYIYDKVKYINNSTPVCIICKEHGEFFQLPSVHWNGSGCPMCKSSYGENIIRNFLEKNNIKYEEQKKFKDCKYKRMLPLDFFLINKKIIIEMHGMQHYIEVPNFFHKNTSLKEQQEKDQIKRNFAKKNNFKLIEIPYWERYNIEKILKKELKL